MGGGRLREVVVRRELTVGQIIIRNVCYMSSSPPPPTLANVVCLRGVQLGTGEEQCSTVQLNNHLPKLLSCLPSSLSIIRQSSNP